MTDVTLTESPAPGARTQIKTICRMCHGGCGALVDVVDGTPVDIHGDPDNPTSSGYFCIKGKASLDLLTNPDRLRTPLIRTGARGSGKFRDASWSEALDLVADRLRENIADHGAESVVFGQGTDRNYQEWVFRLANAVGTPNVVGPAHVCFYPRVMASILTYGGFTFCDYDGDPEVIVLWGSNKPNTHSDGVIGISLLRAIERGSKVVVIDPRRTQTAERADLHLQLRPGSDCALAMGVLHLMIARGYYDRVFVEEHTTGFEDLAAYAASFDPSTVATMTDLRVDQIEQLADLYGQADRACIEAGTGISQGDNAFDTHRTIALLCALSGNLDAPGGDLMWDPMPIEGRRAFPRTELLSEEQAGKRIGADRFKVLAMSGWVAPGDLQHAILSGSPYQITSLVVFGSNPLVSHENAHATEQALHKLDLVVVMDMFMTPTARFADVVFPASSWLERDQVVEFNSYLAARRKVTSVPGCRSDEEVILELAQRLGVGEHFFPDLQSALDAKLRGVGMTWEEFSDVGYLPNHKQYRKYLERGFRTRSGRVALSHPGLEALGYSPVPRVLEPPAPTAALPYVMTSAKNRQFYNSEYRQLATTSRGYPRPRVTLHPATAASMGVQRGEELEVYRDADRPGVVMEVLIADTVAPHVIVADACWWYPGAADVTTSLRSSINNLTDTTRRDAYMGASQLRALPVGLRIPTSAGPSRGEGPA